MSSTSPVALILGAGSNVGRYVAQAFAEKGYKLGLVARSSRKEADDPDQVYITGDVSDPAVIVDVFSELKKSLGVPSVVIYNAASATQNDAEDPLSLPINDFVHDLSVNTIGAFVAAQQAALAFSQLPDHASKTFIYTGNILNSATIPSLLSLGVGKSATAHIIRSAAAAYANQGMKFYYCDERKAGGEPAYFDIDGEAHGQFYTSLSEVKHQGPWLQTFVKGEGYVEF